jgi:hypothetical protein
MTSTLLSIDREDEDEPPDPAGGRGRQQVASCSAWFGPGMPSSLERELMAFLGAHHGVAILHWPRDADRVDHLARAGLPRLLLVDASVEPPAGNGPLQDWLPSPASRQDIHDHVLTLSRVAAERHASSCEPVIDGEGRISVGGGCVELPPCVIALAEMLVSRFGRPVGRDVLMTCESCSLASLQGRVSRLCQCVNPLGLEVVAVPGDAYLMRRCAP